MNPKLSAIQTRCEAQGLLVKPHTMKFDPEIGGEEPTSKDGLIIQIPEERDSKSLLILDGEELEQLETSSFEKYRFIKGYEAIWSSQLGIVECEIESDDVLRATGYFIRRMSRLIYGKEPGENGALIELKLHDGAITVSIGECSLDFSVLASFRRDPYFGPRGRLIRRPTIRIEGLNIKTHDAAKDWLEQIGNSVLFQIDLASNLPAHLSIDREMSRDLRAGRRRILAEKITLSEPKYEYDREPMSIYWYARTATNMPLLQYLAFYQVLEFYFPAYSYAEAQQRIRNLIKDPTFDVNKDRDVSQILSVIRISARGKAIGDEKTQLRSTLVSCVDNGSLWKFFEESPERRDFFDNQKKSKSLATQKIPFSNPDHDLRSEVAARVYEIRCKIVHSKEENDTELLLPFSTEVRYLKHDLELVEYLARKVLIAGSRPLRFDR